MIAGLPRLHAVTDDRVVGAGAVGARAAAMAEAAGPALALHVRTRLLTGGPLLALAREVGSAIAPHGSWLAVNDRADIARAAGARAVVTGRGGLSPADVRRVVPGVPVGRSVHTDAEIAAAVSDGADFLVAGSVFDTGSHPGGTPAGLDLVRRAAAAGRPVIAIGGLTPERTGEVIAAGAWGVAVIRALWDAPDPAAVARAFTAALPSDETVPVTINGESRRARRGITMAVLLGDLGLDARAVVVEHNRHIVRRDALDTTPVAAGDSIELVHFVGGG